MVNELFRLCAVLMTRKCRLRGVKAHASYCCFFVSGSGWSSLVFLRRWVFLYRVFENAQGGADHHLYGTLYVTLVSFTGIGGPSRDPDELVARGSCP